MHTAGLELLRCEFVSLNDFDNFEPTSAITISVDKLDNRFYGIERFHTSEEQITKGSKCNDKSSMSKRWVKQYRLTNIRSMGNGSS